MAVFKCKMCGGALEVGEGLTVCECEYCGSKQTVPAGNDEKIAKLFERANRLRFNNEFDKAYSVYETIIGEDPEAAEAYWGLVLCKYGVEYVDDPATFDKVPTCHRSSFESVMDDENFEQVMETADTAARVVYREQAKQIEDIRKGIIEVSGKEKPYDIFICYKETAEDGQRTIDSVLAQDVYDALTDKGYRVFFSRITLEDKLGTEYEPYIFAALNSAKVMLAFGTSYDNYNAVWVKNEWQRYLKLMEKDKEKHLIPCYKDIDAYDLPKEFARLQAQDMGKVGATQDLLRGIEKLIGTKSTAADSSSSNTDTGAIAKQASAPNVTSLLERAFMFLEDGNWKEANEYCERVLDIDPKCAEAYLGKLMAELKVRKQKDLKECHEMFASNPNLERAVRFANEDLSAKLKEYAYAKYYEDGIKLLGQADSQEMFNSAADIFRTCGDYKDSVLMEKKAREKAEDCRKDKIYSDAIQLMKSEHLPQLESALKAFHSISGWKDANKRVDDCKEIINELTKAEEKRKVTEKKTAKRNIKLIIAIFCIGIALVGISIKFIAPYKDYKDALKLIDEGKYVDAYDILWNLGNYKDAKEQIKSIKVYCELENLKTAEIDDTVTFGYYNQDDDSSNGNEEIEWEVIEKEDNKILLLSKYGLDCGIYDEDYRKITWENCTLREWLNDEFLNTAFSDHEQEYIVDSYLENYDNVDFGTDGGKDTKDKVFLLSIYEATEYLLCNYYANMTCRATEYASSRGVYTCDMGTCAWWLRSPGYNSQVAAIVDVEGEIGGVGVGYDEYGIAVRPAIWINLE